jgi:hypothetical protein
MYVDTYWVYRWIDKHGVTEPSDALKALRSKGALSDLIDSMPPPKGGTAQKAASASTSIVAGRGLDLSGQLDCTDAECRHRQVDDLFRHVWHYFDNIVVADAVAHELQSHDEADPADVRRWLVSHIDVLLYLRSIGAEPLLTFETRRPPCEVHWKDHAEEAGLSAVVDQSAEIAARLVAEGDIRIVKAECDHTYRFDHPEFEHSVWIHLDHEDATSMSERERNVEVAHSVVRRYTAHLSSDLMASRQAGAPLGSILSLHRALLLERPPTVQATAFELDLPILSNVSVPDLLRLRNEERDLFEKFQTSLRLAITERIRRQAASDDPGIASEIQQDVIDPELRRIRQKLLASEQLFNRKAAVTIGVGVLATVCGVLSGVGAPLAATAGISGMLAAGGTHLNKHLEERRDIAESDYYFLWRAAKH